MVFWRMFFLVCSDVESRSYDFYLVPKDSVGRNDTTQEAKRGLGGYIAFVARNRFAILDKSHNQMRIKISEIRSLRNIVFQ